MPLHFSDGGSLHSWWLSGRGEVVAGQISPARRLADVNGSTPTLPCRSVLLACSQTARHLPRALESATVGNAATGHTVWSDCMSHFTWFSFNSTNFNWKGPTNPHIRYSHYECKTGRSDIFKDPLWNAGMKVTRGRLLKWLISTCPCLCLPKEDGMGQAVGTAEVAWALNENSKADSCAFLHQVPWENQCLGSPAAICGVSTADSLYIETCLCKANIYLSGLSKFTIHLCH